MATINESNAIAALLSWITGNGSDSRAREAAAFLADRAYLALKTGMRGDAVVEQWPGDLPTDVAQVRAIVRNARNGLRTAQEAVDAIALVLPPGGTEAVDQRGGQ